MAANMEMIKKLRALVQLDIHAVVAYEQAIEKVDVAEIQERLAQFKSDHECHIQSVSQAIISLGGAPPDFKRDFKGYMIQGFTAVRSVVGTEGALKAMKKNEQLSNRGYDEVTDWTHEGLFPADVEDIIERNLQDERRHLAYIEECIANETWKAGQSRAA